MFPRPHLLAEPLVQASSVRYGVEQTRVVARDGIGKQMPRYSCHRHGMLSSCTCVIRLRGSSGIGFCRLCLGRVTVTLSCQVSLKRLRELPKIVPLTDEMSPFLGPKGRCEGTGKPGHIQKMISQRLPLLRRPVRQSVSVVCSASVVIGRHLASTRSSTGIAGPARRLGCRNRPDRTATCESALRRETQRQGDNDVYHGFHHGCSVTAASDRIMA